MILIIEVHFTYDDTPPQSAKSTGIGPPISLSCKDIGTNKDIHITTEQDNDSTLSHVKQTNQMAQQGYQRQQYPEHRASIASAPSCTARSGSISTITGVSAIREKISFKK